MRFFATLFLVVLSFATFGQQTNNPLVGRWVGIDSHNQVGGIEFMKNDSAKLILMGEDMPQAEYRVDYSKDPVWIDMLINVDGKLMVLFGLIEFIDSTTIKWEIFPVENEKRPSQFSKDAIGTSILLKKQKE